MKNLTIRDMRENPGDSAFLIDDGKTSILYDSGFAFTGYAVAENIRAALGERSLDYIFLTHSHYDHALGSAYAKRVFPNVTVVAAEYAAKIFAKPSARKVMREMDQKFARRCGVFEYEDLIDELSVDLPVQDGDVIRAGNMEFIAVSLPGHTRCSTAYYCAEKKLLLSSETLGVYDGEKNIFPCFMVGVDVTLRSIEKAAKLDIEHLVMPHLGLVSGDAVRFFLGNMERVNRETAEAIAAILRRGGSREEGMQYIKDTFYSGYMQTIYPEDALNLNSSIMVELVERELA
ncbi:MAG: MBL fold metallo-hydrolase [Clostridia bacterium]|nr:MBL fold metallo-hydrolase [Clostridia bacterium]